MNADHRERAGRALDRARIALDAHLSQQALVEVREAVTLAPDWPSARILQARILLKQQKPRLALAALDAHDLYAPEQREAYDVGLLRIEALAGAGHEPMALDLARRLLERWPADTGLHRMAAGLAWQLGEYEATAEALEQVRVLDAEDGTAPRMLSQIRETTDPQRGLAYLNGPGPLSSDPSVQLRAARLCRRAGRLRDAEARYARLVRDEPAPSVIWREAGEVADALGEARLAIDRLTRAAGGEPEQPEALAPLARALMHAGRLQAAVWRWWRRVRHEPTDAEAWAGLIVCAHAVGRGRLADRAWARCRVWADSSARRQALAEAWQRLAATRRGRTAPAPARSPLRELLHHSTQTLSNAGDAYPKRADVHYHHARCLAALHNEQHARRAVDRALAINPAYRDALELQHALNTRVTTSAA